MKSFLLMIFMSVSFLSALEWSGPEQDGVQIQVSLDKEKLGIDEALTIQLTGTFPEGIKLDIPLLKGRMLQGANLIVDQWDLIEEKKLKNGIQWTFDPLLEGTYALNLLTIPLRKGDEKIEYIGNVFPINVIPTPEVQINLKDLAFGLLPFQKEYPIALSNKNDEKWIASQEALQKKASFNLQKQEEKAFPLLKVSFFLLLFAIVYYICKNYDALQKSYYQWLFPPVDPETEALRKFDSISKEQRENFEEGFVEMSNSLRDYIENVYQIRASKLTTPEFLAMIKKSSKIDDEAQKNLTDFLQTSDLVKFAQQIPTEKTFDEALSFAKRFVERKNSD